MEGVLEFLVGVLIVVLAVWAVRRLLDVERGRWAVTLLAVLLAETCTVFVLRAANYSVTNIPGRAVFGVYALVTIFAMLAVVLVELIARPQGRRRRRGIPHPIIGLRQVRGRMFRYVRVTRIAIHNGLLRRGGGDPEVRGSRLGRSLGSTFEDAGGLFVKLGQAMAAQPQIVTRAVAAELARLQDQAAPADPAAARAVIHEELGPPEEIFSELSTEPLGSASIAQTYLGRLPNGREVVVKVQRPGVRDSVEQDLDILARLTDRLDRRTTWAKSLGLKELVAGFAEETREELDFRVEAANGIAARGALHETDTITVPEVIDEYTTSRVLVQERVIGRSVGAPGALDGLDAEARRALADGLLSLTIRQMLGGQPFHADPHPGNVFLRADGKLALIDFGAVGRLDRFERAGLIDMLQGLGNEDPSLVREAALRIGTHTQRVDSEALDRELARLLSRSLKADSMMNPELLSDALFIFRDHGIVLPRSTTTLFRTLVTLLGTLALIAPAYDVGEGVRRAGGEMMAQQVAPENLQELVLQQAMSAGPSLSRLPREVDAIAQALLRGELRTRVSLLSEPEDVRAVRSLMNRLVTGLVGSALALSSSILLAAQSSAPPGSVSLVNLLGGIGLFFSTLLLLRLVVQILRERD